MNKSLSIGIFALVSVVIFTVTLLVLWVGSEGVAVERVAFSGDVPTELPRPESPESPINSVPVIDENDPIDEEKGDGPATVVWINIPGFRSDYVEKASATHLQNLIDEGAGTQELLPNFPALTYPGHVTLATGVTPDQHGIPSDRFKVGDQIVKNPSDPSLLLAEPIWQTATRQGIATLIHDWPFSGQQSGGETDQQRLDRLWDQWVAQPTGDDEKKFRLLMCRLDDVLKAGLTNGPLAEDTYQVVQETDRTIQGFIDKAKAAWSNLRPAKNANLVFLITTNHGLVGLEKNINISHLLGDEMLKHLDVAAHDAIAHLYFKNLPESTAEANLEIAKLDAELRKKTYFRTYKPEDLPSDWNYTSSDGRIGDRVLVLKDGFAFSDHKAEEPIFDPSEGPGLYGGFGYPISSSIRMSGQMVLWAHPRQVIYGDLDEVDQTIFHSLVCDLLEIQSSPKARANTLELNR